MSGLAGKWRTHGKHDPIGEESFEGDAHNRGCNSILIDQLAYGQSFLTIILMETTNMISSMSFSMLRDQPIN